MKVFKIYFLLAVDLDLVLLMQGADGRKEMQQAEVIRSHRPYKSKLFFHKNEKRIKCNFIFMAKLQRISLFRTFVIQKFERLIKVK